MNANKYNDRLAAQANRRRARMAAWKARGLTLEEIGAKFGISRQKVWEHLKKYREKQGNGNGSRPARPLRA